MRRSFILLFCFVIALVGCQKSGPKFSAYEVVDLPIQEEARCIEVFGDSVLIGGGKTKGKGYLLQGITSSNDFDVVKSNFKHEVYSKAQHRSRWYVGCDSVVLYHGDSLHKLNRYWWLERDWVSDLSKHPIWNMASGKKSLTMVAGGKLAFGVAYNSEDSARSWEPIEPENELRAVAKTDDYYETTWIAGNGVFKKRLLDEFIDFVKWIDLDLDNEFITDLYFESDASGWGLTRSGKILSFKSGGSEFEVKLDGKSAFMNHFDFDENNAIAVGQEGEILFSTDGGENWSRFQLDDSIDLNDVQIINEEALIVGDGGAFIRIQLSSFQ